MVFIIGIVIAYIVAILGFTVFVDVGNGLGTVFSIIGAMVILWIAGRLQRQKEKNDPNILLDKMMMLFQEDGFQASTYIFSQNVDKGFAIDDERKVIRLITHQPGRSSRKFKFEVTELSLKELKQVDMLEDGVPIEQSVESDNNEEISTLELRLTMNDQESSTITFTFLAFDVPVRKSTAEYLTERENLKEIYHEIDSMMKSAV
ncbi:GlsB/YeaQ/YmgE family stress response membrane protein [Bacillus safensis]|uniref:GlsB/YeaQ/YmgE family stress response membrane protein n=1 Tax=Bacillus TaxID=1386 RepID=UPI00163CA872|nr:MULTISPECIES: GlsB/YeaQ/YmgE family stress response membrane protein [Bacillus]QNH48805.1 hypothetical protein H7F25_04830 [Bacillus sp. PAMC28571]QNK43100.1 hypothetical protein H7F24_11395 [Bacillus sp. PAMC22265]QWS51667.1 hypothetical protein JNUCC24_05965 [Bacillus sp. JNUCC-24]WLW70692.1 GlsB/YeaQ/YmgE family stress response membrane protein [Bacillus safensis]